MDRKVNGRKEIKYEVLTKKGNSMVVSTSNGEKIPILLLEEHACVARSAQITLNWAAHVHDVEKTVIYKKLYQQLRKMNSNLSIISNISEFTKMVSDKNSTFKKLHIICGIVGEKQLHEAITLILLNLMEGKKWPN